jgi:hypothetical protein
MKKEWFEFHTSVAVQTQSNVQCTLYCGVQSVLIHFQSKEESSYIQGLPSTTRNLSQSLHCINNHMDVPNETRNDTHKPNPQGVNVNWTGNRIVGFTLPLRWVHKWDHTKMNAIHGWNFGILENVLKMPGLHKTGLLSGHIRIRTIQSGQIRLQRSECASAHSWPVLF